LVFDVKKNEWMMDGKRLFDMIMTEIKQMT